VQGVRDLFLKLQTTIGAIDRALVDEQDAGRTPLTPAARRITGNWNAPVLTFTSTLAGPHRNLVALAAPSQRSHTGAAFKSAPMSDAPRSKTGNFLITADQHRPRQDLRPNAAP
jgi:hypothetical protein